MCVVVTKVGHQLEVQTFIILALHNDLSKSTNISSTCTLCIYKIFSFRYMSRGPVDNLSVFVISALFLTLFLKKQFLRQSMLKYN